MTTIDMPTARATAETIGLFNEAFRRRDKSALVRQLQRMGDQDYFERGIELAIEQDHLRFEPVDISDLYAVEVDFAEDLERANLFV